MRVLLVAPHWLFVYGEYAQLSKAVNFHPPLGLCAIAATADRAGHETRVLDAEAEGLSIPQIVDVARQWKPDAIGLPVTTPVLGSARMLAAALKGALGDIPIVAGGPHITLTGGETLERSPEFDYTLGGEAEETFPAFLRALESGGDLDGVPGLHYRRAGATVAATADAGNLDLDALPFADRSKLRLDRYLWSVPGDGLRVMASVQASRGCPLKCIFCSEQRMYPKAIRWKSVGRVMEELETIRRTTSARHIVFLDDTITMHRKWAVELFTEIKKADFGFTWEGETTANRVDEEIVQLMAGSGMRRINFGIESGDPDILPRLGKGVKLEEIAPAYALMKRFGIETRGSVILGNPHETRKSVWRTLRFVWSLDDLDQAYINIAAPYPGTALRDMALRGEGGVRLLDGSYEALRRYGGGVMNVNDLTPKYLARVQRIGTLGFYLRPRRFLYNLRRAGGRAMWRNARAFLSSFLHRDAPVQLPSAI